MTTSGITTFASTRDQIVNAAYRKIGVNDEDTDCTTNQMTNGVYQLNLLIKSLHTDGMPLWAIKETAIPCSSFTNGSINIGVGETLNIPAPLKITQSYLRNNNNTPVDTIPMWPISRFNYNQLASRLQTGAPINYCYEPYNQYGVLFVWSIPDVYSITNRSVVITYQRPYEDMVDDTDTLDFPQQWEDTILAGLAWRLAPDYSVPINERNLLKQDFQYLKELSLEQGTEEASLYLMPDRRWY